MIRPGIYQHFKGGKYKVIGIAKHSESLEEFVVYEALYENAESKLWIRPVAMFEEEVIKEGVKQPRFKYIGE